MSTIIPEKINILSINVFKSNIDTTETYLAKPGKVQGFDLELGQNTAFNFEQKNVRIRLLLKIIGMNEKREPVGVIGDFGIEFHFHVENLDEFITEQDDKKLIDRKLGGTLLGIVFSTTRGMIMEKTVLSPLGMVILPVIDPNILVDKTTKENI